MAGSSKAASRAASAGGPSKASARGRSKAPASTPKKPGTRAANGSSPLGQVCSKAHACPTCKKQVRVGMMLYRHSASHQVCGCKRRNHDYKLSQDSQVLIILVLLLLMFYEHDCLNYHNIIVLIIIVIVFFVL